MLIYIVTVFLTATVQSRELVQGNLVWRHGDRSSNHTYPNDPYKDVWKDGVMQLTEQGMAQEYDLGVFLRSKYGHLLSEKYKESEIYIRSTDTDRSLMSAQCVNSGLYSPKNYPKWNGAFTPWRPNPVHSVNIDQDWLYQIFRDTDAGCPEFEKLLEKIRVTSEWFKDADIRYSDFFKNLTEFTGVSEAYTIDNIRPLYDNLFCLRANGFKLPSWADKDVMNTLVYLAGFVQGFEFTDYEMEYTKLMSRMRSGIILENIVKNMKDRISGVTNYSLIGYSAHDSTVGPLLISLGSYNWIVPPYASCVMIDLLKIDDGSYFVELWYRNDSNQSPHQLSFYECGTGCDFNLFLKIAATVSTGEDTDFLCSGGSYSNFSFLVLGGIVFILCLFLLCLRRYIRKRRKQNHKKYKHINHEEIETFDTANS